MTRRARISHFFLKTDPPHLFTIRVAQHCAAISATADLLYQEILTKCGKMPKYLAKIQYPDPDANDFQKFNGIFLVQSYIFGTNFMKIPSVVFTSSC